MPFLHASCIAIEEQGVLLAGPSGVGKSDLSLRLIDQGARLISDDQTEIYLEGGALMARPPAATLGLIEARGMGLLQMPYLGPAPVRLYVELLPAAVEPERLPKPAFYSLLDRPIRWLKLRGQAASTPALIRFALKDCIQDVE